MHFLLSNRWFLFFSFILSRVSWPLVNSLKVLSWILTFDPKEPLKYEANSVIRVTSELWGSSSGRSFSKTKPSNSTGSNKEDRGGRTNVKRPTASSGTVPPITFRGYRVWLMNRPFTVMDRSEANFVLVLMETLKFLLYYVSQVILMLTRIFQGQFP